MQTSDRRTLALVVGTGLCGVVWVCTPAAVAAPMPAGGPTCIEQLALPAVPMGGAAPVVLPGPLGAGAAPLAPTPPAPPIVPPAPPVAPPVVPAAPPVAPPVVPVGVGAAAAPVADGPVGAPLRTAAGTGKGAPIAPAAAAAPEPAVRPGPPAAPAPISAVLAGVAAAVPGCAGGAGSPSAAPQ